MFSMTRLMPAELYACPTGECDHARVVHDGDGNDEPFMCCSDDCPCGHGAGVAVILGTLAGVAKAKAMRRRR